MNCAYTSNDFNPTGGSVTMSIETLTQERKRSDEARVNDMPEQSEEIVALSRKQSETLENGQIKLSPKFERTDIKQQLDPTPEQKAKLPKITCEQMENDIVSKNLPKTRMDMIKLRESPKEREERLAKYRKYNANRRQKETPEEREQRLANIRLRRQNETPEEREKRMAKNRACNRRAKDQETPEEREKRLAGYQKRYDKIKQNKETPEQREKRRAKRAKMRKIQTNGLLDGKDYQAVEDIIQEPSKLPIILIVDDKKTIKVKIKQSDV